MDAVGQRKCDFCDLQKNELHRLGDEGECMKRMQKRKPKLTPESRVCGVCLTKTANFNKGIKLKSLHKLKSTSPLPPYSEVKIASFNTSILSSYSRTSQQPDHQRSAEPAAKRSRADNNNHSDVHGNGSNVSQLGDNGSVQGYVSNAAPLPRNRFNRTKSLAMKSSSKHAADKRATGG